MTCTWARLNSNKTLLTKTAAGQIWPWTMLCQPLACSLLSSRNRHLGLSPTCPPQACGQEKWPGHVEEAGSEPRQLALLPLPACARP